MDYSDEMNPYRVRQLTPDDVLPALSVVQMVNPAIEATEWQQHIEELIAGDTPGGDRHGMMVLTGPRGYIYGLFSYHIVRSLTSGRTLQIDDFCVTPIASRRNASCALLLAAEELARRSGSRSMTLNFLDRTTWQAPELPYEALGLDESFMPGQPCLAKTIA